MGRQFVFGKTKVAKTSEEIREHSESKTGVTPTNDAPTTDVPAIDKPASETTSETPKAESEKEPEDTVPVTPTADTQQENSESSTVAPPDDKEQKPEVADKPVTATRNRKGKNVTNRFALGGVKTENGIVVNVPMDDYMQLMMLKIQTGRTLKDLALQAIHEFVDRNKM